MIFILIRETHVELPEVGKRCIDRLPLVSNATIEKLFLHCDQMGLSRISGSGADSIFARTSDLSSIKQSIKEFFKIQSPLKITEQFVIFEQELGE
ncbi:hypothetical protein ND856_14225 [Leptospira bandrabouensis]|uniref:hypothetical protein n=1 Tax=Leptospira bandrabouensis TaxID=2484903 RepID=UPI00223E7FB1|nr:hypothetical protein [Leptospira bandrabouensis]MCW7459534.1 hypothetical protein [Leptospira bandrabouensis]MCW7478448.1 hypothetical protein [Leptospira bandrabouensis]MCW7486268.1 hypothetical protein [Leptospira bandrabouensis]